MLLLLAVFLWSAAVAVETAYSLPVNGNVALIIEDGVGHQTPAIEFFRRFERVFRHATRLDNTPGSRELLLVLSSKQPAGSSKFFHSREFRSQVLQLPGNYTEILNSPLLGRTLAGALLQSRLGNAIQTPLPESALWIVDGLWAEFVQRERSGTPILRFTYLDALRQLAENGFRMQLNLQLLTPPEKIRERSAEWQLYSQRSQLMLEIARYLGNSRRNINLIKDYCFLLLGNKLSPAECFERTFALAARSNLYNHGSIYGNGQKDERAAGYAALEILAKKMLFSGYAPMNASAINRHLQRLIKIEYLHSNGKFPLTAALSDLPLLVEKYEQLSGIPHAKIIELNELAALVPLQLRSDIFQLTNALADIGSQPPERVAGNIKSILNNIQQKLHILQQVESELKRHEAALQPLLYEQRFVIDNNLPAAPLPKQIKAFIDTVENAGNH